MDKLAPVWDSITRALADGISVIPVYDKTEGDNIVKKPAIAWKKYQSEIITKEVLYDAMEKKDTTAVAMVCGVISGGLEVIDIDVKYEAGIDAVLFGLMLDMYPDLFHRLRIHKTPSGGYHLLYRIDTLIVPPSTHLAERAATAEEFERNPEVKKYCFIETKGTGGLTMMPPAMGYSVHADRPIPIITEAERNSLVGIARQCNKLMKVMAEPKPRKADSAYYKESPFDHFRRSPEAETILLDEGWKQQRSFGGYLHFTRPGKQTGTSATFDLAHRCYYCFTTNSGLEPGTAYSPAALIAHLRHRGDFSAASRELVAKGFGCIREDVEKRIVKWKALKNAPLPPNVSPGARVAYDTAKEKFAADFPYGVFWERDDDGDLSISREALYTVAREMGFRFYAEQEVVRITPPFVAKTTNRVFIDTLKTYMKDEDHDAYIDLCNTYEAFIQRAGEFTIKRLDLLDESAFLDDTKYTAYKFYTNGVLRIDDTEIDLYPYDTFPDRLIWAHEVQEREFSLTEPTVEPLVTQFLRKAVRYNHTDGGYVESIIGYLAHRYKDETTAYIIVLTEECPDPKQGGGSGKNIFSSLLSHITTVQGIPGSQMCFDERFLQPWNGQRVLVISDVDRKFDYMFLKEPSSGKGVDKKLYVNQKAIECHKMPKFVIQTNYSYEVTDGGLRRRIIPLEFTDFFTLCGGVDVHFGKHFPNDWSADDWAGYDIFMARCIQTWIAANLKIAGRDLSEEGWVKQFQQQYGKLTHQFIEDNWKLWIERRHVSVTDFNITYETFCIENNVDRKFRLSSLKMNESLDSYANHFGDNFTSNENHRELGITKKCKVFEPKRPDGL